MPREEKAQGLIRPEELYTLEEIKRRLGVGDTALRVARRSGLQVHYKHGRGFILGGDWIEYVRQSNPLEA